MPGRLDRKPAWPRKSLTIHFLIDVICFLEPGPVWLWSRRLTSNASSTAQRTQLARYRQSAETKVRGALNPAIAARSVAAVSFFRAALIEFVRSSSPHPILISSVFGTSRSTSNIEEHVPSLSHNLSRQDDSSIVLLRVVVPVGAGHPSRRNEYSYRGCLQYQQPAEASIYIRRFGSFCRRWISGGFANRRGRIDDVLQIIGRRCVPDRCKGNHPKETVGTAPSCHCTGGYLYRDGQEH